MSRSGFQSRQPLRKCVGYGNPTHKAVVTRTYSEATSIADFCAAGDASEYSLARKSFRKVEDVVMGNDMELHVGLRLDGRKKVFEG